MARFRVVFSYERTAIFYVEADCEEDIESFIDATPKWEPGDVAGLIDTVSDEDEIGYNVVPELRVVPNFRITPELALVELDT